MKKILFIAAVLATVVLSYSISLAQTPGSQVSNNLWKWVSGVISPSLDSWKLKVGQLEGSGVKCLHTDNTGLISTSSADCGTGGGGGAGTGWSDDGINFLTLTTSTRMVGLGANPTSKLTVTASNVGSSTLNILGKAGQTAFLFDITSSTASTDYFNVSASGNVMIATTTAASNALLTVATSSNIFTILNNGMVGIRTATPAYALDVRPGTDGAADVTRGELAVDAKNNIIYIGRLSATVGQSSELVVSNRSGVSYLDVNMSSGYIAMGTNLGEAMRITNTANNVGIGVTSPSTKLEVAGVVSSTELRTPSSTINSLQFTNATGTAFSISNISSTRSTAATSFDSPQGNFTNILASNVSSTRSSAATSYDSPQGNFTSVSSTNITASGYVNTGTVSSTSGFVNSKAINTSSASSTLRFVIASSSVLVANSTTSNPGTTSFGGTLTAWRIIGNTTCTASVDIWKKSLDVPTLANSITGGSFPNLSAQRVSSSTNLAGWTTAFSAGDMWMSNTTSTMSGCSNLTVELDYTKL